MRIAALGFLHETNTFQSVKTDYDAFVNFELLRGGQIAEHHANANSTLTGFFQGAAKYEFDLVPLLFTFTGPTGTITKDAFGRITSEMLQMLKDGKPWDGVLLAQHGAAVTEEHPDMDGEVTRLVRQVVGPDTPIVMTFDLHSNITEKQIANTDALVVYRTNPHLDPVERAVEASEILVRTIRNEIKPVQYLVQVPMIVNIVKQPTAFGPMKGFCQNSGHVMNRGRIEEGLEATVMQPTPPADSSISR